MSKTITLSLTDEEHIITIEPGDNFIDILTNILDNVRHNIYSVTGKCFASAVDL